PQYSSKIAETIATETGATVYELDPIVTGDSTPDAYDDYINKMKENLNVLKEALK
ncbi:MAG: zinc ABC transporter substrate-binding protein, partial [Clostridium celatum]|nr:zinc ABC transporter substrate-binding protein [Clostridium celatum]